MLPVSAASARRTTPRPADAAPPAGEKEAQHAHRKEVPCRSGTAYWHRHPTSGGAVLAPQLPHRTCREGDGQPSLPPLSRCKAGCEECSNVDTGVPGRRRLFSCWGCCALGAAALLMPTRSGQEARPCPNHQAPLTGRKRTTSCARRAIGSTRTAASPWRLWWALGGRHPSASVGRWW